LLEEKMGYYDNQRNKDGRSMASEVYRVQDELKRKNELLMQDKDYLTKENIGLLEKLKRLEDKLDRSEKEFLEAKNQA
jgi:progesterone-induced-blocking factor 1